MSGRIKKRVLKERCLLDVRKLRRHLRGGRGSSQISRLFTKGEGGSNQSSREQNLNKEDDDRRTYNEKIKARLKSKQLHFIEHSGTFFC